MNKIITLMTLFCFFMTSCCSMKQQKDEIVSISSNPPGAAITIDGYPCGTTPQSFGLTPSLPHEIVLQKEGYQPQYHTLHTKLSPKKLSSNLWIPLGVGVVGTGTALILTGGTTAGLAGVAVLSAVVISLASGVALGAVGSSVDLYSGKAKTLSSNQVLLNLNPVESNIVID